MAPEIVSQGSIHRAVVVNFAHITGWGQLYYALDERSWKVLDALSAAALTREPRAVRNVAWGAGDIVQLDFHSTSVHGIGSTENWPRPGQFVEVHLNSDRKLVAVWYLQRGCE